MRLFEEIRRRASRRRSVPRRATCVLAAVTCAVLCALPSARPARAAEPAIEYQVKAAFLYNFAKFVVWPEYVFSSKTSPLTLCVVGDDPFGTPLHAALAGRKAHSRRITLKLLDEPNSDDGCHIAFLSAPGDARMARLMHRLRGRTILTVGDDEAFAANGGMVRLLVDNKKIRFDINAKSAEAVGLRMSAQLLSLARRVRQ